MQLRPHVIVSGYRNRDRSTRLVQMWLDRETITSRFDNRDSIIETQFQGKKETNNEQTYKQKIKERKTNKQQHRQIKRKAKEEREATNQW